jgi:hypothetical protein
MLLLKKSIANITTKVESAAKRAGRNPDDIRIVAVTKTIGIEKLQALTDLNWPNIGENRVNDALHKAQALPNNKFTWHMIGRLQSNKVKKAVGLFDFIHSLNSISLAEQLRTEALKISKTIRILIQVNVSNEASKNGINPTELTDFYGAICRLSSPPNKPGLVISGLMTMAPATDTPETVRPYFIRLRTLRDKLKNDFAGNNKSEELKYLSMGMSQDFEVAVEEGANMLRIGKAIFG